MHYVCTANRQSFDAWCRERGFHPTRSPYIRHITGRTLPLGYLPEHDDEIIYLPTGNGSEDDAAYAASVHLNDRQKTNPAVSHTDRTDKH